jgi:hypothetical protein
MIGIQLQKLKRKCLNQPTNHQISFKMTFKKNSKDNNKNLHQNNKLKMETEEDKHNKARKNKEYFLFYSS